MVKITHNIDKMPTDIKARAMEIFMEICNPDKFDLVLPITRRGFNLFEVCRDELLGNSIDEIMIRSDIWLYSAEARTFFETRKEVRVCLFDDVIRYGRNIEKLKIEIQKLCLGARIEIYALARHMDFPHKVRGSTVHTHSDLDEIAFKELLLFYRRAVPYSHFMPRTEVTHLEGKDLADTWNDLQKKGFTAITGDNRKGIEMESNCWRMVYALPPDKFENIFGSEFARIVGIAYIEAFFYGTNGVSLRFVPNVILKPIYEKEMKDLAHRFFMCLSETLPCTDQLSDMVEKENAYMQNCLLTYSLSALLACKVLGKSLDNINLENHFGQQWNKILMQLEGSFFRSKLSVDSITYEPITKTAAYDIGNLAEDLDRDSIDDGYKIATKPTNLPLPNWRILTVKAASLKQYVNQILELSVAISVGIAVSIIEKVEEFYVPVLKPGELAFTAHDNFRDLCRSVSVRLVADPKTEGNWRKRKALYQKFAKEALKEGRAHSDAFSHWINYMLKQKSVKHGVSILDIRVESLMRTPGNREKFKEAFNAELVTAAGAMEV